MSVMVNGTECQPLTCGSCGVQHVIPQAMYDAAQREGGWWFCPNGHKRGWENGSEKTEIGNLRRERDRLKQDQARLEEELQIASKRAARAAKRAQAGVCPCCTWTFSNMARHMKTKHPDFNVIPLKAGKA